MLLMIDQSQARLTASPNAPQTLANVEKLCSWRLTESSHSPTKTGYQSGYQSSRLAATGLSTRPAVVLDVSAALRRDKECDVSSGHD